MSRKLSADEEALWRLVARDLRRGRKPRPRLESVASLQAANRAAQPAPALSLRKSKRSVAPALGGGDPARDRLVAQRRLPVEASLDLHGMTQRQAMAALKRFLTRAHGEGAACVIVITGKGKPASTGEDGVLGARRGVLKERFLEAVESDPLRPLIARVAPAKPKDGGAGAFYIFLKKNRR